GCIARRANTFAKCFAALPVTVRQSRIDDPDVDMCRVIARREVAAEQQWDSDRLEIVGSHSRAMDLIFVARRRHGPPLDQISVIVTGALHWQRCAERCRLYAGDGSYSLERGVHEAAHRQGAAAYALR